MSFVSGSNLVKLVLFVGCCFANDFDNCIEVDVFNTRYSNLFPNLGNRPDRILRGAFNSGILSNYNSKAELRSLKTSKGYIRIHQLVKEFDKNMLKKFQEIYKANECAQNFEDSQSANYFYSNDCLAKIETCVIFGENLYLIGDSYSLDMANDKKYLAYKNIKNEKSRLNIMMSFLLAFENLKILRISIDYVQPEFFIFKNLDPLDVRVMIPNDGSNPEYRNFQIFKLYEIFLKEEIMKKYNTEKSNIFSLAFSFVCLEIGYDEIVSGLDSTCYETKFTESCYTKMIGNIESKWKDLKISTDFGVFKKALQLNPDERYKSIT